MIATTAVPWVPEVFLACGGNFRCWPNGRRCVAGNRATEVSGTQGTIAVVAAIAEKKEVLSRRPLSVRSLRSLESGFHTITMIAAIAELFFVLSDRCDHMETRLNGPVAHGTKAEGIKAKEIKIHFFGANYGFIIFFIRCNKLVQYQ